MGVGGRGNEPLRSVWVDRYLNSALANAELLFS